MLTYLSLSFQVQSDMKTAMKAVREQGSAKMEEELKSLQDKLEQERANHLVIFIFFGILI